MKMKLSDWKISCMPESTVKLETQFEWISLKSVTLSRETTNTIRIPYIPLHHLGLDQFQDVPTCQQQIEIETNMYLSSIHNYG